MTAHCSNPDCHVSGDGHCIEAFTPLDDCPHYSVDSAKPVNEFETDPAKLPEQHENNSSVDYVEVSSGGLLDYEGARAVLRRTGANMIACAGPSEIGKTTLLASIYEILNKKPTSGLQFGGSKTLHQFENICHLSRMESQKYKPETERTRRQGVAQFYHIALQLPQENRLDLLLADRAGEEYISACDNGEDCRQLFEVPRSDTLLLLVDAQSLGDQVKRHSTRRQTEALVRALQQEDMLKNTTRVILTMTRFDLVVKNGTDGRAKAEHKKTLDNINKLLGSTGIDVDSHIVAARPEHNNTLEAGYGVNSLMEKITKPIIAPEVELLRFTGSRSFHQLRSK